MSPTLAPTAEATTVASTTSLAERAPRATQTVLATFRVIMGFYFLWAFLDKTFGLGFSTPTERAWVNGGSPTTGYLGGVEGPFAALFNGIAGAAWADWLFMAGLLGIGLALVLGIGMRVAAVSATLLLALMYLASMPFDTNPILDSHVVEAFAIVTLAMVGAGNVGGLGRTWRRLPIVARNRWLV